MATGSTSSNIKNPSNKSIVDEISEKLRSGGIFVKHSQGTFGISSSHRFVWCTPDLRTVQWSDINRKGIDGVLPLVTLKSIELGENPGQFHDRLQKTKAPLNHCFSLVFKTDTLDLETVSQQERDIWVQCYSFIINRRDPSKTALNPSISANSLYSSLSMNSIEASMTEYKDADDHIEVLKERLQRANQRIFEVEQQLNQFKTDNGQFEALIAEEEEAKLQYKVKATEERISTIRKERDMLQAQLVQLKSGSKNVKTFDEIMRENEQMLVHKKLLKLREELLEIGTSDDFFKLMQNYKEIVVPVAVLPSPDPELEDSDDESDGKREKKPKIDGTGVMDETELKRWVAKTIAHVNSLLAMGDSISLNEELVMLETRDPAHKKTAISNTLDKLVTETLAYFALAEEDKASKTAVPQPLPPPHPTKSKSRISPRQEPAQPLAPPGLTYEEARDIILHLLADLSATQTAGDSYATVNYTLGRCPKIAILRDGVAEPLEFNMDYEGVELIAPRHFKLCDAQALSDDIEKQIIWGYCTAAFQKKISFRGINITPSQVLIVCGEQPKPTIESLVARKNEEKILSIRSKREAQKEVEARQHQQELRKNFDSLSPAAQLQCTREVERDTIQELSQKSVRDEKSNWYIIDNVWLASWKKFIAGGPTRPGPIDNTRLLNPDGTPKPDLKKIEDYRALDYAMWKAFLDMYGGGPIIMRPTTDIYKLV